MDAESKELSSDLDGEASAHSDENKLEQDLEVLDDVQKCEAATNENQKIAHETSDLPTSSSNTDDQTNLLKIKSLVSDRCGCLRSIYSDLRLFECFMVEEHYDRREYNFCTRRETIFRRRTTENWYTFVCSWDTLMADIEQLLLETYRINNHPGEDPPITMTEYDEYLNMVEKVLIDLNKLFDASIIAMTEHSCNYIESDDCRFRRNAIHVHDFLESIIRDLTKQYRKYAQCIEQLKELSSETDANEI